MTLQPQPQPLPPPSPSHDSDPCLDVVRDARAVAGEEADILATAGQRWINRVWEVTQALIALTVTVTAMVVVIRLVWLRIEIDKAVQLLNAALFLILGFYFSRTNHQKTGGVSRGDIGR